MVSSHNKQNRETRPGDPAPPLEPEHLGSVTMGLIRISHQWRIVLTPGLTASRSPRGPDQELNYPGSWQTSDTDW